MKILFYRYNSICEPDVMEQFAALGITVDTIEREITDKRITNAERVELISEKLSQETYLFVFTINFFPAISDVCNIFNVKYVGWSVDSPLPEIFSKSIKNPCNRMFLFDRMQLNDLSEFSDSNLFHLPLGTNVSRWDKVIAGISSEDVKRYSSDISFVGSLYSEMDPLRSCKELPEYLQGFVDGLVNVQKKLQGVNLFKTALTKEVISGLKESCPKSFFSSENYLKDMDAYTVSHSILGVHCASVEREEILKELSKHFSVALYTRSDTSPLKACEGLSCRPGVSTLTEMPKIFHLSKINLNITLRAIETGASLRVWDIMGCGGFLMTNYQQELTEHLVAGEHYDYYTDLYDLIEKCAFYLEHEDIRKKIALNGYELVKRQHTYQNRMSEMIKNILNNY